MPVVAGCLVKSNYVLPCQSKTLELLNSLPLPMFSILCISRSRSNFYTTDYFDFLNVNPEMKITVAPTLLRYEGLDCRNLAPASSGTRDYQTT